MPQDGGEQDKHSEFHELGPLPQFISYDVGSLIRSDAGWNTMMWIKHFESLQLVVWAEALCAGKTNPYLECLFQ